MILPENRSAKHIRIVTSDEIGDHGSETRSRPLARVEN